MRVLHRIGIVLALLLAPSGAAVAQSIVGSVTGKVTDESGEAIASVTVGITGTQSGG